MNRFLFLIILVFQIIPAGKAFSFSEMQGKAIKVTAENFIIIKSGSKNLGVKLAAVKTPGINDKFGKEVNQYISDTVLNKQLTVYIENKESESRYSGFVYIKDICLNEDMIQKGYAAFGKCGYDLCIKWENYEKQAKKQNLGMWEKKPASYLETVSSEPESFQADGFAFSVYEGWVQIPGDVVREYEKNVNAQSAEMRKKTNVPEQHYDYAFQLKSSKEWFEYPYILIRISNEKRIPKRDLDKLIKISSENLNDPDELDFYGFGITSGEAHYDPNEKIIWISGEFNDANKCKINRVSGTIPTQKGFVQVSCCSQANHFSYYKSFFHSVIRSVSLSPNLVYQSILSDNLPDFSNIFNRFLLWDMISLYKYKILMGSFICISILIKIFSEMQKKK
ncbi:MAG: thermonuclease family protein [Desulfococcaceae bacterium]